MIVSAALLALASLSSPMAVASPAQVPVEAYAGDTIGHLKGHTVPARPTTVATAGPAAVCHPDPSKGRACRHSVAQAEEARRAELAAKSDGVEAEMQAHKLAAVAARPAR